MECRIILPPGSRDKSSNKRAAEIASFALEHFDPSLVKQDLSLAAYAATLKNARLIIGVDSSSQHIAATFRVPVISIYRSSSKFNNYFYGHQFWPNFQFCLLEKGESAESVADSVMFLAMGILRSHKPVRILSVRSLRLVWAAKLFRQSFKPDFDATTNTIAYENFKNEIESSLRKRAPALCDVMLNELKTLHTERNFIISRPSNDIAQLIIAERAKSLNVIRLAVLASRSPACKSVTASIRL